MDYTIDKRSELELSRVGIYKDVIPLGISILKLFGGEIRSDFWEYQIFDNIPKISPIKFDRKRTYTGSSKRKLKSEVVTLKSSPITYSLHSLKRYRERSHREIDFDYFHRVDEKWVNELSERIPLYFGEENTAVIRQDILFPFGDGGFLGQHGVIDHPTQDRTERYITLYRKGKVSRITEVNGSFLLPNFTTRTYVNRDQFTWFQEQSFTQYQNGDIDGALTTLIENPLNTQYSTVSKPRH